MIAGIDTHKDTLAVAVVDDAGRLIAGGDIPNTERGFVQLVNMFDTHHVLRVGIEGSGNFGRAVAVHLVLVLAARPAGGGGRGAHLDDLT